MCDIKCANNCAILRIIYCGDLLNIAAADTTNPAAASVGGGAASAIKYPSSAHYTRDWDKLVADIKEEEKNEKPEGDAALNALFQQIYRDGSDETRRAMNKSFVSRCLSLWIM